MPSCCTRCAATTSKAGSISSTEVDFIMVPSPITGRSGIRLIQLQDFLDGEE